MEPIPTTFTEHGFRYDHITREGMWAIYRQTRIHSGVERYEVVQLAISKAHTWPNGITTPEKETYPPSSAWGKRRFTTFTLPEAQILLATLLTEASMAPTESPSESPAAPAAP